MQWLALVIEQSKCAVQVGGVVVSEGGGGNSFDEAVDIVFFFCLFVLEKGKKKFTERKTKTNLNQYQFWIRSATIGCILVSAAPAIVEKK